MSNTYSSTLATPELIHEAASVVGATLPAGLNKSLTMRPLPNSDKPASDMVFKVVRSVSATQTITAPANFEQGGDAVIDSLPASPDYFCQNWNASHVDQSGGLRPEDLLAKNAETLALTKWRKILSVTSAFATGVTAPAATFAWGDAITLLDLLKKFPQKHLILSPDYFSRLVVNAPYLARLDNGAWTGGGWDQISLASDWTSAPANTVGIALSPSAICAGTGLPVHPKEARRNLDEGPAQLSEQLVGPALAGFQIFFCQWFNLATRSVWQSLDTFLGAAVADSTAAFLIKSP